MLATSPFVPLQCVGRNGAAQTFWYRYYTDTDLLGTKWSIEVHTSPHPPYDHGFQVTLEEYDPATVFVHAVVTIQPEIYGRKGIRDSLYPELRRVLGRNVCSSSNRFPRDPSEERNPEGEAVWLRLQAAGLATYDSDRDRFFLT